MNLSWDRLRILDALACTGSVTSAAASLHMTGPAVSQQLRRIESEIGARIVVPDGRGLRLTAQGEILAGYAFKVANLMKQAENDLHHEEELVDHLRLAAVASSIRTVLGERLREFWRKHPRMRVTVEDGETGDHLEHLSSNTVDIVLAESWNTSPLPMPAGVTAHTLRQEDLYIAVPRDHPSASRSSISISDLASERWVTCAHGSDAHTALTQLGRANGHELDVSFFVADHSTQRALVRDGLAVACLPGPFHRDNDVSINYVPLDTTLRRDILLLVSDRSQSLSLQTLVDHLLQ